MADEQGVEQLACERQVGGVAGLDDGLSSALFAGGTFTTIGGTSVNHLARWNGVAWSSVGGGVDGFVSEL
ncbi:MAG: hypothetical protein ACO3CU_11660, partial [Candidatus Nanopelagicales bacterium]